MINKKEIAFYNNYTHETTDGILEYEGQMVDGVFNVRIVASFDKINIVKYGEDYLATFNQIRKNIYPWIPMVEASLKYIFPKRRGGTYKIITNVKLGERNTNKDDIMLFTSIISKSQFASPEVQNAFFDLYQRSFKSNLNIEYGINNNLILLEKIAKYLYIPEKVLNPKPYQYFWAYDEENNRIYDIKDHDDIELYKRNELSPTWYSLDSFIKWYSGH